MKLNILSGFLFFGCLFVAEAQDLSSLINYKKFAADFFKEAVVSYAENVADADSGDACRHFATFFTKAIVEKLGEVAFECAGSSGRQAD